MHFVIHAIDKPDALPRRQAVIDAHRAYAQDAPARLGLTVLISGPLLKDDGTTMGGSFFLLDAPDRASVDAFVAEDPIAAADVWDSVSVTPFIMRVNTMGEAQ